jgi:hypothetical protein
MWYELEMVSETLDSFQRARELSNIPVDVIVCFNMQTWLEQPIIRNIKANFANLENHPALKDATIIEKTDDDAFFNVGDWRREIKGTDGYTIWGESDTLVPILYFPLLEQLWNIRTELGEPHVISLASRKMWDNSWSPVEHPIMEQYEYDGRGKSNAPKPLSHDHYITQEELDVFNADYMDDPQLARISPPKIDGSMLALHPNIPQLISDDIRMVGEDFCAQLALSVLDIPQYHVRNIIKGHNYHHPRKRTNTLANRNEYGEVIRGGDKFEEIKMGSQQAREKFIRGLIHV